MTPTREQVPIHPHTMSVDGWHADELQVIKAALAAARAQALEEAAAKIDSEGIEGLLCRHDEIVAAWLRTLKGTQ